VRDFRVFVTWPVLGNPENPKREIHERLKSIDHDSAITEVCTSTRSITKHTGDTKDSAPRQSGAESEPEMPMWLQGATCIGRITDVYKDEKRFYDTGPYIDALGYKALPGECGTFRIAFQKDLVLHAFPRVDFNGDDALHESRDGEGVEERLVELGSLKQAELLQVWPYSMHRRRCP
jgi:hypothetical protein